MIAQHSIDELLQHILPHVKQHVNKHTSQFKRRRPYLLALTGLQGSGKTTWTTDIVRTLNEQHNLRTIYVSLDDFYLDHDGLLRVREENPSNKLLRVRGQPGTHDVALARQFFNNLFSEDDAAREVLIPEFDKSRFNGEGDRVPEEHWKKVRVSPESAMDVIVLEGWCVGFQPLDESTIEEKWKEAKYESKSPHEVSSNSRRGRSRTMNCLVTSRSIET
jgi:D-glycerate 3-kinase